MTELDRSEAESFAAVAETVEAKWIRELIKENLTLKHELDNPIYLYAGSRISRFALICCNVQISRLTAERNSLLSQVDELTRKLEAK